MKHTVKYWDKKLLALQRLADSVRYDIDSDADYIAACACQPAACACQPATCACQPATCACQPATFTDPSRMQAASPEILPLFYNVVERVQSVKNCK